MLVNLKARHCVVFTWCTKSAQNANRKKILTLNTHIFLYFVKKRVSYDVAHTQDGVYGHYAL